MPVANRADALEGFDGISRRCALCFAIDGALQSLGVPGHHAVGDEREGSGGGDEFLCSAAAFGWQRLRADLPLQSVYGLVAFKHVMKRSAKVRQREVITQMHGALQLPGGVASTKDGIPARSAAKSLKHIGRRTPPFLDRGCRYPFILSICPFIDVNCTFRGVRGIDEAVPMALPVLGRPRLSLAP